MNIIQTQYKHKDHRRTLNQLLTAEIHQINFYDAKKGAILGDHYHKKTTEYFYLTKGTVIYNDSYVFNKHMMFSVEPGEKHKIECMNDVQMFSFLSRAYKPDDTDIFK